MATANLNENEEELLGAARQGNWPRLLSALEALGNSPMPQSSAGLHDRARVLEEALTAARVIRADLAMSAVRVSAAAKFGERQDFAGSTEF